MRYQLLNGWTPHSVFEALITGCSTEQSPSTFYRFNGISVNILQPFSQKVYADIIRRCEASKNTHEAFARWLVANTEGDW